MPRRQFNLSRRAATLLLGALGASAATAQMAQPAPAGAQAPATQEAAARLGDLSTFKAIAADSLTMVDAGHMDAATRRIKDLESSWDHAEPRLRALAPSPWKTVDQAIDRALHALRASPPEASTSAQALRDLLTVLDANR